MPSSFVLSVDDIRPSADVVATSSKATVPVASGSVIVRSAVGSTTYKVVSKSSAVEPSKLMF